MDRHATGAIAAVILFAIIFVVKLQLAPRFQVDPAKVKEEAAQKAADERARRLAGDTPPFQLDDPKEDFSITFPSKPSEKVIVLVGLRGGSDKDWESSWLDDTHYTVHRRTTDKVADDRAYVKNAAKRKIDRENGIKAGKPEEWIIGDQREFLLQDEYPAAEFSYTYKKFSHQEERSGRVLIVKVPDRLYYIQADGPPDYIAAPVTERFFTSFRFAPKVKPPAQAPKKQ